MLAPRAMSRIFYIARHGETVFNAAGRMQGDAPHTPLTRAGFAQAEEMGRALQAHLGTSPEIELWASPTGRALQTLAILAEHLELDWHGARTDPRLSEMDMGEWGGRYYRDIIAEVGPIVDRRSGIFSRRPPGGESFNDIEARLTRWLDEYASVPGERLVIMHGISSRVLRGMLTGAAHRPGYDAPVADGLPQGSIVRIVDGVETVLHRGTGTHGTSRPAAPA
jgi:probable phosphoglycerate mutase